MPEYDSDEDLVGEMVAMAPAVAMMNDQLIAELGFGGIEWLANPPPQPQQHQQQQGEE